MVFRVTCCWWDFCLFYLWFPNKRLDSKWCMGAFGIEMGAFRYTMRSLFSHLVTQTQLSTVCCFR